MDQVTYYFAVLREDRVEYCKGVNDLCDLMLEGYFPVVYAETMKKVFELMSDYY